MIFFTAYLLKHRKISEDHLMLEFKVYTSWGGHKNLKKPPILRIKNLRDFVKFLQPLYAHNIWNWTDFNQAGQFFFIHIEFLEKIDGKKLCTWYDIVREKHSLKDLVNWRENLDLTISCYVVLKSLIFKPCLK